MNPLEQALEQLNKERQMLAILIFAFVSVLVWIAVSFASSQKSTRVSAELQAKAQPLTPNLNREVLEEIAQKKSFSESELANFPIKIRHIDGSSGGESIIYLGEEPIVPASPTPQLTPVMLEPTEEDSRPDITDTTPELTPDTTATPAATPE